MGNEFLGHLTSSGTIANLEALFVAREIHPDKGIAYSADAHYTHARMCHLLGISGYAVATDTAGRMDLDGVGGAAAHRHGRHGRDDRRHDRTGCDRPHPRGGSAVRPKYGVRIHVDAAYGGFFRLIADDSADGVAAAPFQAIAQADSVVVDPHKHGLQPYGCGAVLFKDPRVIRYYKHDSPYTYFTSDELHLGEISLECSRSGAAAAALWLTFQVLPPTPEGLGQVLRPGRRAALRWADILDRSESMALFQPPELDIVTYLPRRSTLSEIDRLSAHVLDAGMALPADEALFVATYDVDGDALTDRGHTHRSRHPAGRILRSVLMKPESEDWVDTLHDAVLQLVQTAG